MAARSAIYLATEKNDEPRNTHIRSRIPARTISFPEYWLSNVGRKLTGVIALNPLPLGTAASCLIFDLGSRFSTTIPNNMMARAPALNRTGLLI